MQEFQRAVYAVVVLGLVFPALTFVRIAFFGLVGTGVAPRAQS
jgi:hypothetical protein